MTGKDKCRALKEIRAKIAEANDIAYAVEECTHKGNCKGTCPRCESELRYLERELEKRRSLGKRVAVAGLAAGMSLSLAGCSIVDVISDIADALDINPSGYNQVMGDVPYVIPESTPDPGDISGYIECADTATPEPFEPETPEPDIELMGEVAIETEE